MTSLITLPIRLPLQIAARAVKLGVDVLDTIVGHVVDERAPYRPAEESAPARSAFTPPPPTPAEAGDIEFVEAALDYDADVAEPAHVDRDARIAYESGPAADPGAAVHVGAPWEDYDAMKAADIVRRLRGADDATRAVVRLYEQQGKARSSVLAAAT